jgi:hypothetical protein
MKRPPPTFNSPFETLAGRLTAESLRAAISGRPSTSAATPSPNRRPPPGSRTAARPAEIDFSHLDGADPAEFEEWQREQRHEVVQRGWGRAIENSGILGNRPPDSRSSPKAAISWDRAFAAAGITRAGGAARAVADEPRITASKSWDAAFAKAGIATKGPRSTPGQSGRRVIPVSRRRE